MNTEQLERELAPMVLTLRVIVFALVMGVIFATVAMVWMRFQGEGGWKFGEWGPITLVALAVAIGAPMMGAFLSKQIVTSSRQKLAARSAQGPTDESSLATELSTVYQTKTIAFSALLEGPAFFNAIAFMIEGDLLSLLAAAMAAVSIAIQFPSASRVAVWVEDQLRLMKEERNLAR